jgi:hypothetical protein
MDVVIVEKPYAHGPCGAKGVGEMPFDGVAPAVVNAIRSLGIDMREIPATPERVMAAPMTGTPAFAQRPAGRLRRGKRDPVPAGSEDPASMGRTTPPEDPASMGRKSRSEDPASMGRTTPPEDPASMSRRSAGSSDPGSPKIGIRIRNGGRVFRPGGTR